ncbi:hypothetical protein O181_037729 [Austropuccinia psidii MF-1]|uniref:Uncharacterized protein n=1 Tax=Austropuccinia psidii MF-1 TaxID=1389203 RepID=A0A9Q3D738_9BASI|nr:hypothetical protein [Austropuccinia psidii MF-1]
MERCGRHSVPRELHDFTGRDCHGSLSQDYRNSEVGRTEEGFLTDRPRTSCHRLRNFEILKFSTPMMNSMNRFLGHSCRRAFSTTKCRLQIVPPSMTYNRPAGGIRSGVLGFLTGLTLTGTYSYLYLLDEYQSASNILLLSVEELKASTSKITGQIKRIEHIENDLKRLESSSITNLQLEKLKNEFRKLVDGIQVEQLKLSSNLSTLEADLISSSKSVCGTDRIA